MVRAPSPEIWWAVDWRLLAEEDGVVVRCVGVLPGERAWVMGKDAGSAVGSGAVRCACCRDGACSDFALAARVALGSLGTPLVVFTVLKLEERFSRRLPLFSDGERPIGSCVLSPCNLDIPSVLFVGSIPGPTLFRGIRAAGFCGAGAGNWL